jgi:site-specific DNA-methyltransferase (adenine-specific)
VVYDLVQANSKSKLRNQQRHSDRLNPKVAELDAIWKDNQRGTLPKLLKLNASLRTTEWPFPFNTTRHKIREADARSLDWIPSRSVHLIVTSPPYWTLKQYESHAGQLGEIDLYENFLDELDKAWAECARVLIPGGRICCVVGDVCVPRKREGRHYVMPLHADIQVFRKGGEYRSPTPIQKTLSMLSKEEMRGWLTSAWSDVKGESTRKGHPAPFPVTVAERLIRLFSFAGDTVLDPFCGTGTTSVAAINTGRNSIACDVEPKYISLATERLLKETKHRRTHGATTCIVTKE